LLLVWARVAAGKDTSRTKNRTEILKTMNQPIHEKWDKT
jgi:hypothetical protein